jgi:hypothetical protein
MRFYILPVDDGKTVCINFDHVSNISISGPTIELFFTGIKEPMVIAKSVATLSTISKGMDLSDTSREQVCKL